MVVMDEKASRVLKRFSHQITLTNGVLVSLVVLLVGIWLVPVLDHHIAERLPHSHLSRVDDVIRHRHTYETAHHGVKVPPAADKGPVEGAAMRSLQTAYLALVTLPVILWLAGLLLPVVNTQLRLIRPVPAFLFATTVPPLRRPPVR